jgi:hypothetical protein
MKVVNNTLNINNILFGDSGEIGELVKVVTYF